MSKSRWALTFAGVLLWGAAHDLPGASVAAPQTGSPYIVDVWRKKNGLPRSSVIAMIQTQAGYLWLGTPYGLVRFDGVRFKVFDESNTPGLGSSCIVHLFEDRQGNLWIGTETAGVFLIKGGKVTSLDVGRGSREGRLVTACEDSNGAVWLYTANGQLCRYRKGRVDVAEFGAQYPSRCRAVIAEQSGPLWVGVDWGLYGLGQTEVGKTNELPSLESVLPLRQLDFLLASQKGGYWRLADGRVQKWRTNRVEQDLGPYPWKSNAQVSAACEDREGNLVVGTLNENDGVYWYGSDGRPEHISSAEGLSHDGILSLCVDREGSLWVGTDGGGLNRVKRRVFKVPEDFRNWVVQSACDDGEGGLWIGANGGEIGHWKSGVLERFDTSFAPLFPSVRAVFADQDHQVWLGTGGAGLLKLLGGGFQPVDLPGTVQPVVQVIFQDRHGRLWIGTQGGLACRQGQDWKVFTTREGMSSDLVRAIVEDSQGNLWIGTERGGLNRFRNGQFAVFRMKDNELPSDNISSLWLDNDDVLWIGTGNGLARLQADKWTRYTIQDGLASNGIGYLLEDGQGNLWIGSNAGLMRVPKKALNDFANGLTKLIPCRVYGESDGLPTDECTSGSQPAACHTEDGKLWFPTATGLISIDPAQLAPNTNQPPVVIESVLVEGKQQNTNALQMGCLQTVTVPAGKESLEIHYAALNLAAADPSRLNERTRFKHRMEGHETAWHDDTSNARVAQYSKLPPGEYRFRVTACNEDGVWNEAGTSLLIVVEPPFWRTWWFLSVAVACLLGAIVATVYFISTQKLQRQLERFKQQEAIEKERSRIARDLHDQLGANLTQVALLGELVDSDKESPAEVEASARQISKTARETTRALDEIVWAANPANDTLEGLITYACKYAQEYLVLAGLRYRVEVPDDVPGVSIPPDMRHNVFLAFKEALTNVVKHAQASEVWLRLRLQPTHFILEIQDNGRGFGGADEEAGRNGLRNMRKRMADVGGEFSIAHAPKGGTLVCLTAPIGKG